MAPHSCAIFDITVKIVVPLPGNLAVWVKGLSVHVLSVDTSQYIKAILCCTIRIDRRPGGKTRANVKALLQQFFRSLIRSFQDLVPIILVIGFFQLVVLQQPVPQLGQILAGGVMVLLGLTLFVQGLQMALFPLGEEMAYGFVRKGNLWFLLLFAFTLGFGTTVAEPALIAIADEAAQIAAEAGVIADQAADRTSYATGLRLVVALAVGAALLVGVIRILKGWPVQYLIIGGYVGVVVMTAFAPPEIIGIAYDSGGVTTSTVTVPLVAALGIGLASSIRGRDPLVDGFGLIAFASLTPMIFVMAYGMLF
jgi:hypothetical protein